MPGLVFDTSSLRPADRFDWWATAMDEQVGMSCNRMGFASDPFVGKARMVARGSLMHLSFEVDNTLVGRSRAQISQREWGSYFVYREMGPGGQYEIGERRVVTQRGDLLIYDGDGEFRGQAKAAYNHHLWIVPKALLDPHLPPLPRPLAVHIPAGAAASRLAVAYIAALSNLLGGMNEEEAAPAADNLGRLIAMACGGAVSDNRDAMRAAKLAQCQLYVDRNLASIALDATTTSAHLGISVRQLHMLFETTGESFGAYVRRRRLAECKATLENPRARDRSITDIALGWGFASLPTFYRAFGTAFGQAPNELRRAHALYGNTLPA